MSEKFEATGSVPVFKSVDFGKDAFVSIDAIRCDCGKLYVINESKTPSPASEYSYSGPTIKPIPPYSTRCTKCGYELKPVDHKCPQCKDPEPPLRAQVAVCLEYTCWTDSDGKWRYCPRGRFIPEGVEYPLIPPYDTDIKLAMGALEKYREMHYPDAFPIMILENRYRSYSGGEWTVVIGAKNKQQIIDGIYGDDLEAVDFSIAVNRDGLPVVAADSLPEAICRAIVKHAEGR